MKYSLVIAIGLVTAVGVTLSGPRLWAANDVFYGQKQRPTKSMDQIDHRLWSQLLRKYVDDDGMVNYAAWHRSNKDVRALEMYLTELSSADRTMPAKREARLAFWINAYNALTIRGILREYPTTSIRNHTPVLWGYHIWKNLKLYVGQQAYSLNEIEHEILRKMNEPRIHFAIVCASISCPRLLNEAYTAEKLDEQLELNAKDFFRRPRNFRYDASANRFYLSSILDWFGEDFGKDQRAMLKRIAPWLPTKEAAEAARRGSVSVTFLDYNWNLNKQS